MARPRTASALLELRGAFKQNPQRKRLHEPETAKIDLTPPEHLSNAASEVWAELTGLCAADVLQQSDRPTVEIVSVLLAEFREDPREFPAAKLTRLQAGLGLLGMSPSDRSRVIVVKPHKNEFADL